MGVTFQIPSKPEMFVLSLPSYFTPSSRCDIRRHLCARDIHTSNFFFLHPENCYQQAKKTQGDVHSA